MLNPIKLARLRAGLSQKALAKELGVSVGAVCQWEKGITNPTAKRLKPLAKILATTVDDLLRVG